MSAPMPTFAERSALRSLPASTPLPARPRRPKRPWPRRTEMIYVVGLDIGSTYTKAIALDGDRKVVGTAVRRTGFKLAQASEAAFEDLLKNSGLQRADVVYVGATGYGRYTVPFRHAQVTELTAHAQAAVHLFPDTRTILDIGGQDIKAIKVDEQG